MNRKSIFLVIALLTIFSMAAQVFAAGTAAGTVIKNKAYGGYSDANGNVIADVDATSGGTARIESDEVETTVTQVYGVDVTVSGDASKDILRNGTITFAVEVENTGNGTDSYDLSEAITAASGSSTFTRTIYVDDNGNGVRDAGENTTASSITNLAADGTAYFIVQVEVTDGEQGETATSTFTAESQGDGTKSDYVELTSTVQAADISGTLGVSSTTPAPGDVLTYTLTFSNSDNTNSDVAYGTVVTLPTLPSGFTWGGTVTKDGTPITDPGAGGTISFGDLDPDATSHTVTFTVTVNTDAPNNATFTADVDIDYDDSTDDAYPTENVEASTATVNKSVDISSTIDPESQSGDPGDEIVYKLTVQNDGNGDDSYTLSLNSSTQSWGWTFYVDDGNGTWDGSGTDAAGTTSGTVAKNGTKTFWAVYTIPAGTADADEDVAVFRFTASDGTTTSDETGTTTVTAPVLTLDKAVDKSEAAPGETLTYTIDVINSGTGEATNVYVKDTVPTECTYVAGSMKIGGTAKTDASDGDGATLSGSTVIFSMSSLAGGATVQVQFQVTVK
ncbi:DUF11 domain-containing protein [bacterium]|nr:DUF11 domain-containing protein [bacterium]